ncbi:hypothetical protein E2C01_012560 [Portunus trituberculatus]|uniref:Uncharacterized protein n=1 Tax=Portunus trituberculatus TaxID=210409 RepID=A0A5B7DEC3_PORTR|nr:hypothetical protein [Portunus trituberculatus]
MTSNGSHRVCDILSITVTPSSEHSFRTALSRLFQIASQSWKDNLFATYESGCTTYQYRTKLDADSPPLPAQMRGGTWGLYENSKWYMLKKSFGTTDLEPWGFHYPCGLPVCGCPHTMSTQETLAPSEEAQPTLGPRAGFEPVRLETPQTPKHAWFHCTTAVPFSQFMYDHSGNGLPDGK